MGLMADEVLYVDEGVNADWIKFVGEHVTDEEGRPLVRKHMGPGAHRSGSDQASHAGTGSGVHTDQEPTPGEDEWATGRGGVSPFATDVARPFSSQWSDEVVGARDAHLADKLGIDGSAHDTFVTNRLAQLERALTSMPDVEWSMMRDWYGQRHDQAVAAASELGVPLDLLVGTIAALSSSGAWDFYDRNWTRVGGNFDDAVRVIRFLQKNPSASPDDIKDHFDALGDTGQGEKLRTGYVRSATGKVTGNLVKITAMWEQYSSTGDVSAGDFLGAGSKTRNFYNNIMSPDTFSGVTVDRWDARSAINDPKADPDKMQQLLSSVKFGTGRNAGTILPNIAYGYPVFADSVVSATSEWNRRHSDLRLLPHEVQAILWWQMKIDAGDRAVKAFRRGQALS